MTDKTALTADAAALATGGAPENIPGYLPALDGLRFACASAVVVSHAFADVAIQRDHSNPFRLFLGNGDLGAAAVDLFFSLSGFLITKLLLDELRRGGRIDLRAFYMRRVLRIWPAYYTAVVIGYGLALVGGAAVQRATVFTPAPDVFRASIPASLLFVKNWIPLATTPTTIRPLWSVCIEEQFYLLFPVALLLSRGRYPVVRVATIGLAIAWTVRAAMAHSVADPIAIYSNTFSHADPLIAGTLLAQWLHRKPGQLVGIVQRGGALAEAVVFLGFFSSVAYGHVSPPHSVLTWWFAYARSGVLAAAVVAFIALGRGPVARCFSDPWARALGGLTYGCYVFHEYGIIVGWQVARRFGLSAWPEATLRAAVSLVAAYVVALTSKHVIEDRFLRMKSRWQPRSAAPAVHP